MMETQQRQVEQQPIIESDHGQPVPDLNTSMFEQGPPPTFDLDQIKQEIESQPDPQQTERVQAQEVAPPPEAQPDRLQQEEASGPPEIPEAQESDRPQDLPQETPSAASFDIEAVRHEIDQPNAEVSPSFEADTPPPEPPGGNEAPDAGSLSFDVDQIRQEIEPGPWMDELTHQENR